MWEWCQVLGSGYPVSGIRAIFILHPVSCILHTPCAGFSKTGTRYLGPDTRYRIDAEGRTPSTEDRARLLENAHTGYASWSRVPGAGSWYLEPDTRYRINAEDRTPSTMEGTHGTETGETDSGPGQNQ
jgi:hypothetical protein